MQWGYNDFVGLSSREYKAYLKSKSDEDPKTQEVKRLRGEFAACYSTGAGVGFAVLTSGGPLVFSAIALRKRELCKRKYDMIREELEVRNVPLDTTDWKDLLIPVATGFIGTNIGLGVSFGLQNAVRSQPPVYYGMDDVSQSLVPVSALNQALGMLDNLGDASVGFEKGYVAEPGVVAHSLSNRTAMTFDFSQDYDLNSQSACDYGSVAETAGFAMGAQAAERTEKTLASLVVSQTLTWLAGTLDSTYSWAKMRSTLDCKRQLQVGGLCCDYCDIKITRGCYKHCCACSNDDFDLCNRCYDAGERCPCRTGLHTIQFSTAGETYIPERQYIPLRTKYLGCDRCGDFIHQGIYYQCLDCRSGNFDLCERCYIGGETCLDPTSHNLRASLWAYTPDTNDPSPYLAELGNGGASCNACKTAVWRGVFFHCQECNDGTFDLCHKCYWGGERCHLPSNHCLTRFSAYLELHYARPFESPEKWFCDVPGCGCVYKPGDSFFQCRICDDGRWCVCVVCYGLGFACLDKSHAMHKTVITS